mmetsp:Transcript_60216/g.107298  ORF Transcript_60216/g.107298 Transcript_60216/m.107298 type:complete len:914 (+) Transcript_60216:76-2817(+)
MALVAAERPEARRSSQLPLSLFLSPRIPVEQAAALRELARVKPRYGRVVDSDEGALHVHPDFDLEELTILERRRCRVIGLPFAHRFFNNPASLEVVRGLPLYDFILPPESFVCCSGLSPAARLRCSVLAKWMGAIFSEEITSSSGILVVMKVNLEPTSKYQIALAYNLPTVQTTYLEAVWAAKRQVDVQAHVLPALAGLRICFDPRHAEMQETYREKVLAHGALLENLDYADVVIVKDVLSPFYEECLKIGRLVAPPLWLERCFQLKRCVPISAELKVPNPTASSLMPQDMEMVEGDCNTALLGCVICLLYLAAGQDRKLAKAWAWKCGAFTTLNPLDRAITHVVFKVIGDGKSAVSVSIPVDDDRVSFVDVSWLEACAQQGLRVHEQRFPQQAVGYNPLGDIAHAAILGRTMTASSSGTVPNSFGRPQRALDRQASAGGARPAEMAALPPLPAPAPAHEASASAPAAAGPTDTSVQDLVRSTPTAAAGVFAGLTFGLVGWAIGDVADAQALAEKLGMHGAATLRGGAEAVLDAKVSFCVCRGSKQDVLASTEKRPSVQLVTMHWIQACIVDGVRHPTSNFPHFEPCRGPLPLPDMSDCAVRLTAFEVTRESHRRRNHLEDLAKVLGARVVQGSSRLADITHFVCVVPGHLEAKRYEDYVRKNKKVVSVQWLFDCYSMQSRQPEERYSIDGLRPLPGSSPAKLASSASLSSTSSSLAVLATHEVFISPAALGSDAQLPCRAEELGAEVHTWRNAGELRSALEARGIPRAATSAGTATSTGTGSNQQSNIVVLIEKEEAAEADGPLAACVAALAPEQRSIFVLPAWLSETFSQRRPLPLEAFAALPIAGEPETSPAKRLRVDEATYAWQSAASDRLEAMAEDSRARAMQSKAQQKVSEGLRLAELRREPSRLGG